MCLGRIVPSLENVSGVMCRVLLCIPTGQKKEKDISLEYEVLV